MGTETDTNTTDTTTGEQTPAKPELKPEDSPSFKQLRKRAEAAEERAAKLTTMTAKAVAQAAGFDTSTGVTELVIEKFCTDDRDIAEFTPEKFTEFATSKGLTPKAPATEGGETTGDQATTGGDAAAQLDVLTQHADTIRNQTTPAKPADLAAQIAAAEAKGDWAASMSLKDQLHQAQATPKASA